MVSIIVPAYNSGTYIKKCMESLIKQTYSDIEIIVVNDGSTDHTRQILDTYAQTDKRIKVFHTKNRGVSEARNMALLNATGDYITFVDADDYLELNAIELLVKKIMGDNSDIVISAYRMVYENNAEDYYYDFAENKIYSKEYVVGQILDYKMSGYLGHKLYRSSIWRKNNLSFENVKCCEDWPVMVSYVCECDKVSYINKITYNYVQHSNSCIHKSNIENVKDFDYAVKKIISLEFIRIQDKNDILEFRTKSFLNIIHELQKISRTKKINVYKLGKKCGVPTFTIRLNDVLTCKKVGITEKMKVILWKMRLYGCARNIFRKGK